MSVPPHLESESSFIFIIVTLPRHTLYHNPTGYGHAHNSSDLSVQLPPFTHAHGIDFYFQ